MNGPYFGFWLTFGTVALCVICLVFAALYWIENYQNATRSEDAVRREEARLEQARRQRAMDAVNAIRPLSQRPAVKLGAIRNRRGGNDAA